MNHSLLKRQLKKLGANETSPPSLEKWNNFLECIDQAYQKVDQERALMERSLMISSQEMHKVNEQLRESETRYALSAKGANDGLWDWDLETGEVYYSERWLDILGMVCKPGMIPTKNCWIDKIHMDDHQFVIEELDAHLNGETEHFQNEHRVLHSDGEYRWVLIRGLAVRDENGKACRIAGSLTDVTDRKDTEAKLEYDAVHDELTGLPNRAKFMRRITDGLEKTKTNGDYSFAVLFIDLDRFKTVNDNLGHQAGDELLMKFTEKLRSIVRSNDMIARLGGDEFVIFHEHVNREETAHQIAQRLLEELKKPIKIQGQLIYWSASIGIAVSSSTYHNADELLCDSDIAMYRAKLNGKARYEVFDPEMRSGAASLMQIETDLRRAFERKEFILHYQPIISLDNESIIGFEALVRWNHPLRGMIPPNEFIPVAEDTGLVLPIGKWILKEACHQMRVWQERFPLSNSLTIAVNLSAVQLEQADLSKQIADILEESRLNPECLRLEITESVIMKNAEQAAITVKNLRKMGVRVSIDDFGTGYSSLSYLHRFPVDTLKVDRSFINRIGQTGENCAIIQTIINLARSLNMEVVAEGVETVEQLEFLRGMDCAYGQGFYYSRPVDSRSAAEMVKDLARLEYSSGSLSVTRELSNIVQ